MPGATSMNNSHLENLVYRYMEAFEKSDLEIIKSLYAENAVLEDPVGSPPRKGIEQILEFYKPALKGGMNLELVGKPRCAGSSVAFMFEASMPGMMISPIDVFDVNAEGKIERMRAYWSMDNLEKR